MKPFSTAKWKIIVAALAIGATLTGIAQPFQTGHTSVTFTDPARNNRSIATEIYYPADVSGNNVPVTTAVQDRFPVLVFGHGFTMTWSAYENIWTALAPQGFILAFPKTEGSLFPSHSAFGTDLAFVATQMQVLGQNSASLLYQRIDSMNCVMGHSMGGGAAFLAAQQSASIKAIATLAAAETSPSAINAAASLSIPSLLLAGGNDCVTPPPDHQLPMYNALQSDCKTYISITGGSHCQMAEYNFYCAFGEATCSPSPAISRAQQHVVINRYLIPWLQSILKGDAAAGEVFDSTLRVDPEVTWLKNCVLCDEIAPPLNLSAIANGSTQVEITWTPNIADQPVLLCYTLDGLFGEPDAGTAYQPGITIPGGGEVLFSGPGNSFVHNGLMASSTCHYKAFSYNSAFTYSQGVFAETTTLPENKVLTLTVLLQGLYQSEGTMRKARNGSGDQYAGNIADLITVELHPADGYGIPVYISENTELTTAGLAQVLIPAEFQAAYYITVKHRNSIESASAIPVSLLSDEIVIDFTDPGSVFGANLFLAADGSGLIYSGDVNQDGLIDTADMTEVENDAFSFSTGYLPTDVNGDGITDTADMTLIDNNAAAFVNAALP